MRLTRTFVVSLAIFGVLALSPTVRAAEDEPADAVRMSLSETLTSALEHNLDLGIARKDPEISYQNVLFQKATFDPNFIASITHSKQIQVPSQVFQSSEATQEELTAGFTGLFKFGMTWSAGLTSIRSDSNSSFNAYNPSYDSGLALGFKLPLLKGLGKEVTTLQLLIAQRNLEISHEELRRLATGTLRAVEDAYWNLRASREAQRVAEQTLKLSQDLFELNKKKVEVGTLAPIEITQAEANVASNVELTIRSKEAVANAEDNLRRLLAIPHDDPLWSHPIIPTEVPVEEPRTVALAETIEKALVARPEIIEARAALENFELSERAARNLARHQLDLSASVTPSGNNLVNVLPGVDGIAGTGDDVPVTGNLGNSVSEIGKFNNYAYRVNLTYAVPLRNRAAKASYAIARIERERQEISIQNTEDLIRVDVRTAVRSVETGYERIVAARKNVELQTKKLEAEQKKFENGMSTSFEVFTFQTDLRNAQLSLIQALLDYNKALADLERAKGTLLESKGLKIASDEGGEIR